MKLFYYKQSIILQWLIVGYLIDLLYVTHRVQINYKKVIKLIHSSY